MIPESALTFLSLPARIARQAPDAPALVTPEGSSTFGELNLRADAFAARIARLGLPRERPIAVCLERSRDAVVALLGVLRAGHPYLPLDPRQPAARRHALAGDAAACAVVARGEDWGLPRLLPEGLDGSVDVVLAAADPAYLIHTSGTTGQPKAVEVTHGALAAYPDGFNAGMGLAPGMRCLHVASFAYSASVRQLFLPLCFGCTVVLAALETVLDPVALLELIHRERIDVIDWVPSYLRQVCEALERLPEARRAALMDHPFRLLVSSGEPLPWSLVHRWRALGFRGRIGNAYGLTETTGLVTWHEAGEGGPGLLVPLGRALPHARLDILQGGRAVAPGEEGTLCISGPCLARAYRDRGSLLPLAAPWATGDRVRREPDGTLAFAGRQDDQIKLHGIRIALGEVEEALRTCPGVHDAAVLAETDEISSARLLAFVVADDRDEAALRRLLRECLPDVMVPGVLHWRDALPRTLNGKLDRQALAAETKAASRPAAIPPAEAPPAETPPGDTTELLVRRIWAETLGEDAADGDFFELGGDSMGVIAMLGRINVALGTEIPLVAAFFGDPTLEGLLEAVKSGKA